MPLLAILNTVVRYIASRGWERDPALARDPVFGAAGGAAPLTETDDALEDNAEDEKQL